MKDCKESSILEKTMSHNSLFIFNLADEQRIHKRASVDPDDRRFHPIAISPVWGGSADGLVEFRKEDCLNYHEKGSSN